MYEGGTGSAYNDKEEFDTTGYAPQPLSWTVDGGVINISYTLANKTKGYKLNKKKYTLINIDGKTTYIKNE